MAQADFPPLMAFLTKIMTRSYKTFEVPVYKDATIAKMAMQPVIFSHGLSANRMTYASMCMELASCGYLVIVPTHNDQSAQYSPKAGYFDSKTPRYTYKVKNL